MINEGEKGILTEILRSVKGSVYGTLYLGEKEKVNYENEYIKRIRIGSVIIYKIYKTRIMIVNNRATAFKIGGRGGGEIMMYGSKIWLIPIVVLELI